jgi:hypothetical protein
LKRRKYGTSLHERAVDRDKFAMQTLLHVHPMMLIHNLPQMQTSLRSPPMMLTHDLPHEIDR